MSNVRAVAAVARGGILLMALGVNTEHMPPACSAEELIESKQRQGKQLEEETPAQWATWPASL